MTGRLSSHRFRRRLAWGGGSLALVAAIVVVSIAVGNTGKSNETPIDHSKKPWVYKAPTHMSLSSSDRVELYAVARRFVQTAVARKQLDSAWDMLGPEMKAGQTRRSWDTGFNNVVPFQADGIQSWTINYSYQDDVALDLSLYHNGKGTSWSGKTFTLELKRDLSAPTHPWLVVSWVPKGVGGGGSLNPDRPAGPPPPGPAAQLSGKWLFLPLTFLAALLLGLGAWAIRNVVRGRRASRRYAESLGYK